MIDDRDASLVLIFSELQNLVISCLNMRFEILKKWQKLLAARLLIFLVPILDLSVLSIFNN